MLLYNTGIFLYTFFIHFAALFKSKAKLWVQGRRNWKSSLETSVAKLGEGPRVWIHCASLGEFEQGRPIIETLRLVSATRCAKSELKQIPIIKRALKRMKSEGTKGS